MTRITADRRLVLLMAIDAPLHLERLLNRHALLGRHLSVATGTLDPGGGMFAVAEEHKIRQLIDEIERNLAVNHRDMTRLTLRHFRKARTIRLFGVLMARYTLQFQRGMLLMIEWLVFSGSPQTQGKEKATKESEYVSLYLLPPPAAITTYCFLVFFEKNVMGVACPLAGRRTVHSSFPVSLSKARKRLSSVAPMNTSPPAVTMEPPILDVPVGGTPFASSASTTPSTLRQRNSPVLRSIAVRCPHGGFWHGHRFISQKREDGEPLPRVR